MCASLLDLASQSRVDGNGEIENRPEDGAYPGVIRRIIAGLPPGSLTAQRNTAISHGAPRRSLTVLDHNQHVTIVAVVSVVARDDTGVSDEPETVTGTARSGVSSGWIATHELSWRAS